MRKRMMLLALCAALVLVIAGCTQVTEERGMPSVEATAIKEQEIVPVVTATPTAAPIEVPEGKKGPDEPGVNG